MENQTASKDSVIRPAVEALCKDGHRLSCSPQEARAANWMKGELEKLGLDVGTQTFKTQKTFPGLVFLHVALALVGALLIGCCPWLALAILLVTTASFTGEYTSRWHWFQKLIAKGESQNVIGHYRPDNPKRTIIFGGHIDSTKQGLIFNPTLARLTTDENSNLGPLFLPFISMCSLCLVAFVASFGGAGWILTTIDWVAAILLTITAVLMIEWMRGEPVMGANDNASGIAAVLALAERLMKDKPDDTEYYFVGFGAEEPHLVGSSEFVKAYCGSMNPDSTYVINFDGIAAYKLHYASHEGVLLAQAFTDQEMIVLARNVIKEDSRFSSIRPTKIKGHTDALPFAVKGFKALSLVCLDDYGIPINYHTTGDTVENMTWDQSDMSLDFAEEIVRAIRS